MAILSIERLRDIEPSLNLTDEELEEIRASFYDLGQIIFDDWLEQQKINHRYINEGNTRMDGEKSL